MFAVIHTGNDRNDTVFTHRDEAAAGAWLVGYVFGLRQTDRYTSDLVALRSLEDGVNRRIEFV